MGSEKCIKDNLHRNNGNGLDLYCYCTTTTDKFNLSMRAIINVVDLMCLLAMESFNIFMQYCK